VEFVKVKRWKGKERKRQEVMSLPGDQSMVLFDQPSRAIEEACCCLADDSFKAVSFKIRAQLATSSNRSQSIGAQLLTCFERKAS
jgi:hypothetical protein